MTLNSSLDTLRADVDLNSNAVELQQLYERWLKRDRWLARSEALPLIVGIDPLEWPVLLSDTQCAAAECDIWEALSNGLDLDADAEPVVVAHLYEWLRTNNVVLPSSFTRLYDFIRQTTLASKTSADDPEHNAAAPSVEQHEKEIVLGAALALLSKMPERCRDERGFVDSAVIVKLIRSMAVRWFPLKPPRLRESEMVALLDKWLT